MDTKLAQRIGLDSIDEITIASASGQHDQIPLFLAHIHVPNLEVTLYGEIAGVYLMQGESPHQALLGRDFLRRCVMNYNGPDGRVVLETTFP